MESVGICVGASTVGLVRLEGGQRGAVRSAQTRVHEGNPRRCLQELLDTIPGLDTVRVAATGRKFRDHLPGSTISEPEAVELAAAHLLPDGHPYRVIVSAGGETFMVYHLDEAGRIQGIHTGNKCASGTGEFFLQQLGRMNLTLEEVAAMPPAEQVHPVSGRCSVFCKSDCTHALNKGVPKVQVVAGLTRMMAAKIVELLKKLPRKSVMVVGGCAQNAHLIRFLREEIEDLFVPREAPWFEALGAAVWAQRHETKPFADWHRAGSAAGAGLSFLKPLSAAKAMVTFNQRPRGIAAPGDRLILGLDVGSTTTKGVLMRRTDKAIVAAEYLRTDGDPVAASRKVYASLAGQVQAPVAIEGLGVTGSGRQIAGLHAMTDGVINEIIAHAAAAVHFDADVDTIFEIGGQDAKYTYITNGVASDYAMNEACSAGTGSFLEESAKEALGLDVTAIGPTAYAAQSPPNFNDQCAAFIGSDIKRAVQEGVSVPDIVAGLVYSVCMNYANRVKGNRPVGAKVFMQGGVCYNEAVPAAMAALTGKEVVVPPEPGLMGAFGVALEVERRIDDGRLAPGTFHLDELAAREVVYRSPFICNGGKEQCDRACEIARIEIDGVIYPFGGVCNRYDNVIHERKVDTAGLDLVEARRRRLFRDLAPDDPHDERPTIGLNRSFLVNTYFPFYNRFFAELGFRVVLPDTPAPEGIAQQGAAFCFPAELAHGFAADLLAKEPDFVFLPHLRSIPAPDGRSPSCTCVFVQAEPYVLKAAFPALDTPRTLTPCINLTDAARPSLEAFEEIARQLGVDPAQAGPALDAAHAEQDAFWADIRALGAEALARVRSEPEAAAVILFGRSYNSFVPEANKGIPGKLASRGVCVIPYDMLPADHEELEPDHNMYWAVGRMLLQGAHYVAKDPQLFGTYITNFSCGPDSFLVGFFRDVMGRKPSLTLELDSHTADAGLETRIEAFLDIVRHYRHLASPQAPQHADTAFRAAAIEFRETMPGVRTSQGRWIPLEDERVRVVLPAMGRFGTSLLAKSFGRRGIRAIALPPADEEVLRLGRGNASCKECLPLQTTVGSLLRYLDERPPDEVTVYFMASTNGPCRFGQYHVFSKRLVEKLRLRDVAVLSLTSENGYGGLGDKFLLAAWRAIIVGDLFDEMWSTILAAAEDREAGLAILAREHEAVLGAIDQGWQTLSKQLAHSAARLAEVRLRKPYPEVPKLSLVGEIYVRRDPISLQGLIERLAERGFAVRQAQTSEWFKYCDWLVKHGHDGKPWLGFWTRHWVKRYFDHAVRKTLAPAGMFLYEEAKVEPSLEAGRAFISPNLGGEAILTVGSALHEIVNPSCGVISIGPFGCMPSRVAESILNEKFTTTEKRALAARDGKHDGHLLPEGERRLPFLAIETDGNAFPQVIEARLEAFCLQAERLHRWLMERAGAHT
ncbi:MAG: activase [Candidatus Hydrogenedentes bacterium]|nr:activase [Candidatus Hydrogenedentota bacterium]